jgi:hypothetical protein
MIALDLKSHPISQMSCEGKIHGLIERVLCVLATHLVVFRRNRMYKTVYVILGTYRGRTEEIDRSYDMNDAAYLAGEYRMAYGREWNIFVREEEV